MAHPSRRLEIRDLGREGAVAMKSACKARFVGVDKKGGVASPQNYFPRKAGGRSRISLRTFSVTCSVMSR